MGNENCEGCRFWKPLIVDVEGHSADGSYTVREDGTGLCRRRAPAGSRIPLPATTDSADAAMMTLWPVTMDIDWCGDFEVDADGQAMAISRATAERYRRMDMPGPAER